MLSSSIEQFFSQGVALERGWKSPSPGTKWHLGGREDAIFDTPARAGAKLS
jgi:hypothetical protein